MEDDERKLIRETERGAKARIILENEIFREAIQKTQDNIVDAFTKADPGDTKGLQRIRLKLQVHAELVREIQKVMETGKIASTQLQQMAETVRGFFRRA